MESQDQEPRIDWERQKVAKEYARLRRIVLLLDTALGAFFVVTLLITGASVGLQTLLTEALGAKLLVVGSFFGVFYLAYALLLLPVAYFGGYRLARRFGLSTQSTRNWLLDWMKSLGISLVFGLILVEILYYAISYSPHWWIIVAGIVVLFYVLLANLGPILLVPLFYRLTPIEDVDLAKRLVYLSAKAGAKVRGVYRINLSSKTTAANAALMGLGNTRRIVLGDTLLEKYSNDEIETVYAHELGHHVHGDIPALIAVQSITIVAGFYVASIVLDRSVRFFSVGSVADVASLPLFALTFGILTIFWMPITNAFSRWLEHRADVYALNFTRKARAFRNAMVKLCNQNLAELHPSRWIEILLYDHPAIGSRIRLAEQYIEREAYD